MVLILMINKKRADVLSKTPARFIVHPMRIELISSEPESGILSIELRVPIKTSGAKVQIILLLS